MFRNVLRLHLKISKAKPRQGANRGSTAASEPLNSEAEDEVVEAVELTESSPSQLSYWIAHAFSVRCECVIAAGSSGQQCLCVCARMLAYVLTGVRCTSCKHEQLMCMRSKAPLHCNNTCAACRRVPGWSTFLLCFFVVCLLLLT
jgi:hypothetical protein